MCIFAVSTEHPDYRFILIDNRDEVYSRPTAGVHWWAENQDILAPQDLLKPEKGTWIGISRTGRIAVLVNVHEEVIKPVQKLSRGALPKQFLESSLSPQEWIKQTRTKHEQDLEECGGFTMVVAEVTSDSISVELLSNRQSCQCDLPRTFCISNDAKLPDSGEPTDAWPKVQELNAQIPSLFNLHGEPFEKAALEILQTNNPEPIQSRNDLRKHIYIPKIKLHGEAYGTRTHTIIAITKDYRAVYREVDIAGVTSVRQTFDLRIPR